VDQDIDPARDDFGTLLRQDQRFARGWGRRRLWTYVPSGAVTAVQMRQTIRFATGTAPRRDLDGTIPPTIFSVATPAERDALYAWLRGDPGTIRERRPLGDIFHSNPLVVAAPEIPLLDQTFSQFRQRRLTIGGWRTVEKTIGTREQVVYVGTNDGILHAFNADTGEEIWGFVPPYLTGTIRAMYPNTHQYGVDGTPVAREVIYTRSGTALGNGDSWRTVLVVGLRGGGGAYVALDVTDPYDPKFLWQFTDTNLVNAYGIPSIATIFTSWNAMVPQERAVAILPGGAGTPEVSCTPTTNASPGRTDSRIDTSDPVGRPRPFVRCWRGQEGQHLYVVDLETGQLIRDFGPTHSPLVGSPALHAGTQGSISTRAYVGDADGGLWRLDMSDPNPANWRFSMAFDLFYDAGYNEGQPIVAPPVLSIGREGETLIAVGSGDPDLLEGHDRNRIAVYREDIDTAVGGAVTGIRISKKWELRVGTDVSQALYEGERLTGAMSLFNGVLYFGTFVPSNSADFCEMGFSRLWGVDENVASGGLPEGRLDLDGDPATPDLVRVTRDINGNGTLDDDANSVLFGVGIVRRPSCVTTQTTSDPYAGGTREWVNGITGGDFRLVAQTGRGGVATGGSRTTVVSRRLPSPIVETRINAWATIFE
jgi:type IV pilus assembly protein PilY1